MAAVSTRISGFMDVMVSSYGWQRKALAQSLGLGPLCMGLALDI